MVQGLFQTFLTLSLVGTILAFAVLCLGKIAYKRLGTVWYYTALVAVAIVMLLPIRLEISARPVDSSETAVIEYTAENTASANAPSEGNVASPIVEGTLNLSEAPKDVGITRVLSGKAVGVLSIIWLLFAGVFFVARLISFFVFWRRIVNNSRPAELPSASEYFGRAVNVRIASGIGSPFVYGLFRPVLVLPDKPLSEEQLDGILRHEAVHVRRCDILVRWLLLILRCVHWFNPASYLLARRIEAECEISCDYLATKGMTDAQRRDYAMTLLSLLPTRASGGMLTTAMSVGKRNVARRLVMLKRPLKPKKAASVTAFIVTLALAASALTAGGAVNGRLDALQSIKTYSENGALVAFVENADTTVIKVYTERGGKQVMSIPYAVMQAFPASDRRMWEEDSFGYLDGVSVYCGEIGDFRWAFVATGPVMSSSNLNLCTSKDGGRTWYVDNSLRSISKGIVADAYFVSESEAYIVYSGGGYGRGFSKTTDGGITWEHSTEFGSALPLSEKDALSMLKNQLKIAYLNTYGEYTPRYDDPGEASGDRARLPYIIENLKITSDDGEYYTVPVIWDFLIEKETGNIFKLYRGLHTMLIPFDPYESTALAFVG